jgi:site-specific recombinase XerD
VDLRWEQSTSKSPPCTSVGSSKAHGPRIPAVSYAPCGDSRREQVSKSPFVFTLERGAPFTTAGFARMIERAGVEARFGFKPHPHMLRHACGYALANRGHDTRARQAYLGHKNIQHTVCYTELSPTRFKNFWRE